MASSNNQSIELISKTLEIVEALRDSPEGLSLQQLVTQTGQVKSSIHRILRSLAHHGYVEQDFRGASYRLGIQFLVLARGVRAASNLVELARPHCRKLRAAFDESTYIAVLRGGRGVFVDVQETRRDLRLVGPLGAHVHFHATAAGKAIAAFLTPKQQKCVLRNLHDGAITPRTLVSPEQIQREWDQVRSAGYAVNDEETIVGAVFLASPVFDSASSVCASLSIGVPKSRYTDELSKRMTEGIKQASQMVSNGLEAASYVHENGFPEEARR